MPESSAQAPCGSFGGRFVDELMRATGTRTHFRYKLIQDLRRADREKTIRLLRREAGLEYRWVVRIREAETPELVAREMATTWELGRAQMASILLPWGWNFAFFGF